MSKLRVGVVRGGISTERDVSLNTGKEIISHLNKEKYEIFDIILDKKEEIIFKLKDLNLDFVYIALHGAFGEDGKIQAILETLGIAYSGPGVKASAICMDKGLSKKIVSSYGVRVSKGINIRKKEKVSYDEIKKDLGEKIVVKPNSGGSSIGVSFVKNQEELDRALELVFTMDDEAIIEEVLEGIEISVPIIDGKVFPTLKIEAVSGEYFDYNSKYSKGGAKEYVFEFDKEIQEEINKFTLDSYRATKCKGFARIDFIVVDGKIPYFMEVNTLPGMTSASLLPKSTASKGYSYSQTLDLLIEASIKIER